MITMCRLAVTGLLIATLLHLPLRGQVSTGKQLVFNTTQPVNDLEGTLAAQVLFAQSQVISAHPREDDVQPHLVSKRKSLLMVRPLKTDNSKPVSVVVRDAQGKSLRSIELQLPKLLPKTAYYVDDAPEGKIDFPPKRGTTGTVQDQGNLQKLEDESGEFVKGELRRHALVEIEMADGQWVRNIYLPEGKTLEGKIVRARSQAGYQSTIHYSGRQTSLSRGGTREFKYVNGQWFQAVDLENNGITLP